MAGVNHSRGEAVAKAIHDTYRAEVCSGNLWLRPQDQTVKATLHFKDVNR